MSPQPISRLTEPGKFVTGCNYWASHAGTAMWSDWRPEVVKADLEQLSRAGLQVLRVFPLWPDFQPLTALRGGHGQPVEYRHGEELFADSEAGQAGVSLPAFEHFQILADLAQQSGLKLIVGLITGWMSGRMFMPPALEGLNLLTDPLAIQWQVRFVRYFVRRFRDHPAIEAWDLGNEINCMAPVPSRQAAWLWTATIANAIRVEDATRPVVSGLHSLLPARKADWTMQDQGELLDLLTTHPYPIFTPHCDQDPVNTLRNLLHATAESRFYADIGGKPCLCEEIGTLGPIIASESIAAAYARTVLFSLWANDCHGLLWWCAYDQLHLEHAPYDWAGVERELGLVRIDRSPKPVLAEIGRFRAFIQELPVPALPLRLAEAVCILSEEQDQWGAAFSSFILAKQAGFDLEFQHIDQPLKPARLYLLPSVSGFSAISRHRWLELLDEVKNGAVLYFSHNDCLLSPFNEPFGMEVQTRQRRIQPAEFTLEGSTQPFKVNGPVKLALKSTGARVLGSEADGNPLFTCNAYGRGRIYFLGVPLELALSQQPGGFYGPEAQPFYAIYQEIARPIQSDRAVSKDLPDIGITEHPLDDHRRVVVAINYSPEPLQTSLALAPGWQLGQVWHGSKPDQGPTGLNSSIPANEAIVFTLNL